MEPALKPKFSGAGILNIEARQGIPERCAIKYTNSSNHMGRFSTEKSEKNV